MRRYIRNRTQPSRGPLATLAIAIVLALGLSATSATAAFEDDDQNAPKATVVFVHGGWADSSGGNQEITSLESLGYPVIAAANPLRDLTSDAAYFRSILTTIDAQLFWSAIPVAMR